MCEGEGAPRDGDAREDPQNGDKGPGEGVQQDGRRPQGATGKFVCNAVVCTFSVSALTALAGADQ